MIGLMDTKHNLWPMLISAVIAATVSYFISRSDGKITWQGFYYPKGEISTNSIDEQQRLDQAPKFTTVQDCMHWGKEYLKNNINDGFECSYDCRIEENWGLICKDTTKMITTIKNEGSYK